MMTVRECYRRIALFEKADFIPHFDGLPGRATVKRWRREGLPEAVDPRDFFGFDTRRLVREINLGPIPGYPPDQDSMPMAPYGRASRNAWGTVRVHHGDWEAGYAEGAHVTVRGALQDRGEWDRIRNDFLPDVAARYPRDWENTVNRMRTEDAVWVLEGPSMVGALHFAMGLENYCTKLYDDRAMIEEIMDKRSELAVAILGKALDDFRFDMLWFWEDCAFRNGPLISPSIGILPRHMRRAGHSARDS
jgi:uroporphyrinogen decarboxylase